MSETEPKGKKINKKLLWGLSIFGATTSLSYATLVFYWTGKIIGIEKTSSGGTKYYAPYLVNGFKKHLLQGNASLKKYLPEYEETKESFEKMVADGKIHTSKTAQMIANVFITGDDIN